MQYDIYRKFVGNIKILQIRADSNGEKEQAQEYKHVVNILEQIKNGRHLAMISEENEEKRMYREIIKILEEKFKNNDEKTVLRVYEEIKSITESYLIEREEKKEIIDSEKER